jgi:hypothetical protein
VVSAIDATDDVLIGIRIYSLFIRRWRWHFQTVVRFIQNLPVSVISPQNRKSHSMQKPNPKVITKLLPTGMVF